MGAQPDLRLYQILGLKDLITYSTTTCFAKTLTNLMLQRWLQKLLNVARDADEGDDVFINVFIEHH